MRIKRRVLLAVAAITLTLFANASANPADSTGHEPADPAVVFARELVAKMTPEEKISQLVNSAPAISRLGIPAFQYWSEGLHGLLADIPTTNFPQPIGLAATFDDGLVREIAGVVSKELRANYSIKKRDGHAGVVGAGLSVWSPTINIFRDPRWGRGPETYGEDPFLTARMAVAYIRGLQGDDPENPLAIATPKHFAAHSGPEPSRSSDAFEVSVHDLEETYLPAFRAAVVEANAGSVMCAYNAVNGQPACANEYLLKTKLRGDWGFDGFVVSDCGAVKNIADAHKYAKDLEEATGMAFRAGVDNECDIITLAGWRVHKSRYEQAVSRGDLPTATIDEALVRLFAARYRVGDLESAGGKAFVGVPPDVLNSPEHVALARSAAARSIVLLKNDGVLPLAGKHARIAVVGPYADSTQVLYGSYSSGLSSPPVSVADGLRAALPDVRLEVVASGPLLGNADVVPTTALRTPGGEPGLLAAYYSVKGDIEGELATASDAKSVIGILMAASYEDDPAHTQIDPQINMPFRVAPPPGVTDQFRVVWKGFLVPEVTGTYQLGVHGIATSMSFNGEPFTATTAGDPIALKTLRLEAGHPYPIEVSARKSVVAVARLLWKRISEQPEADAVAAAKQADLVVAVVGINSTLESEESAVVAPGFDRGDRTSLDLPADQLALLEAVKETGKPLVVISMSGSALDLSWARQNANALLHAWYPGQEGGHAVADILTGKENPAGRLPVTFYRSVADLPPFKDYSMQNRTYRYFDGTPLYPFGYGLSYTRFEYSALGVAHDGDTPVVTLKVSNVGERDGDEIVQLYLRFPQEPDVPDIALRGFQRVHVKAGESRHVEFRLAPRDLGTVSADGEHRVLAGEYELIVGGGLPESGAPNVRATLQVDRTVPLQP